MHHSSIQAQCDRYWINPVGETYTLERIAGNVLFKLVAPEPKWKEIEGDKISIGKTYKDYIKESGYKRLGIRIT